MKRKIIYIANRIIKIAPPFVQDALKIIVRKYPWYRNGDSFYPTWFHKKENVVYLNIPKAACTSIKKTFFNGELKDPDDIHQIIKILTYKQVAHLYKFTFVRNPYTRLVSCYINKFKHNRDKNFLLSNYPFIRFNRNDSFSEFIKKIAKIPDSLAEPHFRSQYSMIYRKEKCLVDYIGNFETLEKDFRSIQEKYKLNQLPYFNRSTKKKEKWKNYYTKKLEKIVHKRYKKDFETWYPDARQELIDYLNK